MSNLQIRVHSDDWSFIYSVIGDYWDISSKAMAFHHTHAARSHYHIYLFDISTQAQSVRKKLKNYFKGNEDFSVGNTCGKDKRKITLEGAYIYGTTKDGIELFKSKGISEVDILKLQVNAKSFYDRIKSKADEPLEITLIKTHELITKVDHTWERLLDLFTQQSEKTNEYSIVEIKKWIIADYLNRSKPIPRMADLNRYSYSLFYMKKSNEKFTVDNVRMPEN